MDLYEDFSQWLDDLLENNDMPAETEAYCFNLYEESAEDSVYSVQLVACDRFDANDPDWACDECWSSEEDIFCIELSDEDEKDCAACLALISQWVGDYLDGGRYGRTLTSAKAVGIGFVDGDLETLFKAE